MERLSNSRPSSGRNSSIRQIPQMDGSSPFMLSSNVPGSPSASELPSSSISIDDDDEEDDGDKTDSGAPLGNQSMRAIAASGTPLPSSSKSGNMVAKKRKSQEDTTSPVHDAINDSSIAGPNIDTASGSKQPQVLSSFTDDVDNIRNLASCKVCSRLLYEPYTLACGHTFCYLCLCTWFSNAKMTCPECRAVVKQCPTPSFLIKDFIDVIVARTELISLEEYQEHKNAAQEDADLVKSHREDPDPTEGGLFKGIFSRRADEGLGPIMDEEDGVERCPYCAWELEEGWCNHCDRMIATSPDGNGIDFSTYGVEHDFDSSSNDLDMDDHDLEGDLDFNAPYGESYGSDLESIVEEMGLDEQQVLDSYIETFQAHSSDIQISNLLARTSNLRRLRALARHPRNRLNSLDEEAEDEDGDDDDEHSFDEDGEADSSMNDFIVNDEDDIEYESDEDATNSTSPHNNSRLAPNNDDVIDLVSPGLRSETSPSQQPAARRTRRPVMPSSSPVIESRRRQIIDSSPSPQSEIRASGISSSRESSHVSVDDDDDDDDDGPVTLQRRVLDGTRRLNSHSQGWSSLDHDQSSNSDGVNDDDTSSDEMSHGWALIQNLNNSLLQTKLLTHSLGIPRASPPTSSSQHTGSVTISSIGSRLEFASHSHTLANRGISGENSAMVSVEPAANYSQAPTETASFSPSTSSTSNSQPQPQPQPQPTSTEHTGSTSSNTTANSRAHRRDQILQQRATMLDTGVTNSRLPADPRISHLLSQYIGSSLGEADAFAHLDHLGGAPFSRPRTANRSWTPLIPQPPSRGTNQSGGSSSVDQHGVSLRPERHISPDNSGLAGMSDRQQDLRSSTPISPIPLAAHRRPFSPPQNIADILDHPESFADLNERLLPRPNSRPNRRPSSSSHRRMISALSAAQPSPNPHAPLSRNPFAMFTNPIIRPAPSTQRLREQSSTSTVRPRASARTLQTQPPLGGRLHDQMTSPNQALADILRIGLRDEAAGAPMPTLNPVNASIPTSPFRSLNDIPMTHHRRVSRASLRSQGSSVRLSAQPSYQRLAPQPSTRMLRTAVTPVNGASPNGSARSSALRSNNRNYFEDEERQMRAAALVRQRQQALNTNPFLALNQPPFASLRGLHPSIDLGGPGSNHFMGPMSNMTGASTMGGTSFQARINRTVPAGSPLARPLFVSLGRETDVH